MPDQLNRAPAERTSIRLDWCFCFLDKLRWLADWRLRRRLASVGCALTIIARHHSEGSRRWRKDASASDRKRKLIVPPQSPISSPLPSSPDLALRRLRYSSIRRQRRVPSRWWHRWRLPLPARPCSCPYVV